MLDNKDYKRLSINVAFLSKSNIDFLAKNFEQNAREYCINALVTKVPFGQWMTEVNNQNSFLRKTKHDYIFFIETIDDMVPFGSVLSNDHIDGILRQWSIYLENIESCRKKMSGIMFVATPIYLSSWASSVNIFSDDARSIRNMIDLMNNQLLDLVNSASDMYVFDLDSILKKLGKNLAQPSKYKYLARAPFSIEFNQEISNYILGIILSLSGKSARLIVLDLDNTLWGGVIGDDGVHGISIGGDYPGNIYQMLQKIFLLLRNRGFALAIASKNTENIAIEAFTEHSEMILSIGDFVVCKINWAPKYKNIEDIAKEVGLGLDSICFIDDSLAERKEIKAIFPEIFTPELPSEVANWPEFILNLPELSCFNLTNDDLKRSNSYKLRTIINSVSDDVKERELFLSSLEMSIGIEPYSIKNKQRILQLVNKTNQFNTTTRRYNESDIEKILINGQCFSIRLRDNIGTDEIVGVLMIKFESNYSAIDNFLLSCRVLGRDIETAVLYWLYKYLNSKKIKILRGKIIFTERNKPVQGLYLKHGFVEVDESNYELVLGKINFKSPTWIKIEDMG
jgi:FkbH-like protein